MKKIFFYVILSLTLYSGSSFGAIAQQAVYDLQILENGVVTGVGIEVHEVSHFDPSTQLHIVDVAYSIRLSDGSLEEYSYQRHLGKNHEADHNGLVDACTRNVGAIREDIETPAGKFETCKGPWGFQMPDESLTTYIWVGRNAKGYIVKEVVTAKTESGLITQRIKVLKEFNQ